jgi:hypothetical protein
MAKLLSLASMPHRDLTETSSQLSYRVANLPLVSYHGKRYLEGGSVPVHHSAAQPADVHDAWRSMIARRLGAW